MLKSKKEEQLEVLYQPKKIEITLAPKEENKLTELEKNSKSITIKISEENLVKKNLFFSKFTCKIECPELESSVIRTLDDIEWLKNQLNDKYPMVFVPPFPDKKCLGDVQMISRYVQRFFDMILRRKILRTSSVLQGFLTLDEKSLESYKKTSNENVFKLSKTMDNYKTNKESLKFDFEKEQITLPDKYIKKMEPTRTLYSNLFSTISQIAADFYNLNKHMKDMSDICGKLYKSAKDTDQPEVTKKVFENLKGIFNSLSTSYLKQADFFDKDFKEVFHFANMELNEMNFIYNKFNKKKSEYESLGLNYLNKREKLFNDKKYNKWELTKEDEAKLDSFKDNKEEAFKYICKEMGENVETLKLQVGCFCNIIMKQFSHINKYIGEQLKAYFETIKEKNKEFIEEGFAIGKLINVQIQTE